MASLIIPGSVTLLRRVETKDLRGLPDDDPHQILTDLQPPPISLPRGRQNVLGRGPHAFPAGEKSEMRENRELRLRLSEHPAGLFRKGVMAQDSLDLRQTLDVLGSHRDLMEKKIRPPRMR